ncbi:MAG: glycosyltransferase family 1 protein [Lachnospiraceae bacterium]|jgi:glycosyltransferase involved in cell wall biosynthesis|nr:glycosyltransferase family 1 protein [Lachnospiraceae bacterium]
MLHVLHYITGLPKSKGGVESFLLNIYDRVDKEKYRFSLLTRNYVPNSELYNEFCRKGIKIYSLDSNRICGLKDYIAFKNKVKKFFDKHVGEFDFIHSHYIDDPFILRYAKRNGIKKAALHAHAMEREVNSKLKRIIKSLYSYENMRFADFLFACSDNAGRFYYGKKYYILIRNTLNTEKYKFQEKVREKIRTELNIEKSTCALCYTGRFSKIKNIPFLLEVLYELVKKNEDYKLFLIGTGTDSEINALNEIVNQYKLKNHVIFTGVRDDVECVLQGMDIYIQSSISEGFPFSVLEAECSGLPCLLSEGIPDSVVLTDLPHKIPLESGSVAWADYLNELINSDFYRDLNRGKYAIQIEQHGFDAKSEAKRLCEFYGKVI